MEIAASVYQKFYDVLIKHIALNELNDFQRSDLGTDSYLIWEENDATTGRPIFEKIFGIQTRDYLHFYKKRSSLDPEKVNFGLIKDGLMVTALRYLGFHLPQWHLQIQMPLYLRAKVLYQLFLEKHMPAYFQDNVSTLRIFDHKTGYIVDTERARRSKSDTEELNIDTGAVSFDVAFSNEELEGRKIIENFITHLQNGRNFGEEISWNMLTDECKEIEFKNEIGNLYQRFSLPLNIIKSYIFSNELNAEYASYSLFFECVQYYATSSEINSLLASDIVDIEGISKQIEQIRKSLCKINKEERFILADLFDSNLEQRLLTLSIRPYNAQSFLDNVNKAVFQKLYEFKLVKRNGVWLISGISILAETKTIVLQ